MSAHDYSGLDVASGRRLAPVGWSLFVSGLLIASIGIGIILLHVLVVLMYARSLAE